MNNALVLGNTPDSEDVIDLHTKVFVVVTGVVFDCLCFWSWGWFFPPDSDTEEAWDSQVAGAKETEICITV